MLMVRFLSLINRILISNAGNSSLLSESSIEYLGRNSSGKFGL